MVPHYIGIDEVVLVFPLGRCQVLDRVAEALYLERALCQYRATLEGSSLGSAENVPHLVKW